MRVCAICCCLLLFNRPPVCEVCPKHEVTRPRTGTYPDLVSVTDCYVAILYAPLCRLSFAAHCPPKRATYSCPSYHSIYGYPACHRTGSSTHPGFPCFRPSIPKSPRIPRYFPHGVLLSVCQVHPVCCLHYGIN